MFSAASFPRAEDDYASLKTLVAPVDACRFQGAIRRWHLLFAIYARTAPAPLPAPGLIVTPEIRAQSERYLPIAAIAPVFTRLYAEALTYPPLLSSTPFHNAMSWADAFAALPPQFQNSANPARLLEALLADNDLLLRFLFASFLPERFYGAIGRYPRQQKVLRELLALRKGAALRCLDAACGTGEETYSLALLLSECGFPAPEIQVEGWTVEPLEVWAAARCRFPHDPRREVRMRNVAALLRQRGYGGRIVFRCADLTATTPPPQEDSGGCDLILCNGLFGGPLLHEIQLLSRTIRNLTRLLNPGGILLAADNFHGGWKQKCPQDELRALFEANGLETFVAGEGIGGLKPD